MWTLAEAHSALMVSLEHRYYGESRPVPDMSIGNLKHLTSEQVSRPSVRSYQATPFFKTGQRPLRNRSLDHLTLERACADVLITGSSRDCCLSPAAACLGCRLVFRLFKALEDAARFVAYVSAYSPNSDDALSTPPLSLQASTLASQWVAFGGSYPGSLATWLKLKYPRLLQGAVGSSAPVFAEYDYVQYAEVRRQRNVCGVAWEDLCMEDKKQHKIRTVYFF